MPSGEGPPNNSSQAQRRGTLQLRRQQAAETAAGSRDGSGQQLRGCLPAQGAQITSTSTAAQIHSQISQIKFSFFFSNAPFTYFDSLFFTRWVPAASQAPPLPAQARVSPRLFFLLLSSAAQEGCSSPELHRNRLPCAPWDGLGPGTQGTVPNSHPDQPSHCTPTDGADGRGHVITQTTGESPNFNGHRWLSLSSHP